jgi:ATP-dependent DNA ligase
LATIDNGIAKLWSRTRKPITSSPHIVEELQQLYPTGHHKKDGELYNHAYKDNFEELASLIRQVVPAPNHTEIQYHIYDNPSVEKDFSVRIQVLNFEFCKPMKYLKLVDTIEVANEEEMTSAFNSFIKLGYEGSMARNAKGLYEGKRSYDLQKVKDFLDAEFKIVGIKEGRGSYANCAIFVCHSPTAPKGEDTFDVKMRGSKEQLMNFFFHHDLWKGKELVVKYQYMSKYGIPIFPVGERFKDEL